MSTTWEVLKEHGNEEFKKGNYMQAINHYTEAINQNDNQEVLFTNRALCQINLNHLRKGVYDLNKALSINPKSIKALKRLANVRIIMGELGEAKMIFEKCVSLEPKAHEHLIDLTKASSAIKEFEEINSLKDSKTADNDKLETLCKDLLNKCKEFSTLKLIYIQTLLNNCKPAEAIGFLNSKISEDEKANEEFEYLTVMSLYYDGKVENAKKWLNVLMHKYIDSPKFKKILIIIKETENEKEKANLLFKQGDYENAMTLYTKILEIDPNNKIFNSTIYANRALCLQKTNKLLEAMGDINISIGLNSNYSKAYIRRGNINMALTNYEDAKYDYQKVKEIDPSNHEVHKLLEEAKLEEKKAKKKDYYKILELQKGSSDEEVKKAYRRLALRWHPDKNSESEETKKQADKMFKDVNEAYSILKDPKKKQLVDNGMYSDENGGDDCGHGGDFNPQDVFQMFFNQGGSSGKSRGAGNGHRVVYNFGESAGGGGKSRTNRDDPFSFFFN